VTKRLGVGVVGSGFIAGFYVQSWTGVRDADIVAIYSRNVATGQEVADAARSHRVGEPVVYDDLVAMVRDPNVDAIWFAAPNHVRVELFAVICEEVMSGRAELVGIACEKPLARTVGEARQLVDMVGEAGLLHGYLENQVFSPSLVRAKELVWARGAALAGPPYLARCAEEHSGPHRAWFWDGRHQGGGVLNDMMCHSIQAGRYLLTKPGERPADYLIPRTVTASIASLKWTRAAYADELATRYPGQVDYRNAPAEDYARSTVTFENAEGHIAIVEATTSWSFVGAGLRLSFELLGPEYSLAVNSLDTEAKIFLSRNLQGEAGEDLVEKQNAEQGLMPVMADEAFAYGYTAENRHMVQAFLDGRQPEQGFDEGLRVTELLMASYLSAERGETIELPVDLSDYVPKVAQGTWDPRAMPKG
jgi:predicted dehydrogenase